MATASASHPPDPVQSRDAIQISVQCYGASARWCGAEHLSIELPAGAEVHDAIEWLAARYPEFAARRDGIAVAVDDAVVTLFAVLVHGSRLALIPPVSGG